MSDYKVALGKYGENLAAQFLRRQNYRLIDRNYYTNFGEIDLIAAKGDELLFCEVKTRTSSDYGYPEEAVNYFKLKHLFKAIQLYLNRWPTEKFWRLDIISVEIDRVKKTAKIRQFKNIQAG